MEFISVPVPESVLDDFVKNFSSKSHGNSLHPEEQIKVALDAIVKTALSSTTSESHRAKAAATLFSVLRNIDASRSSSNEQQLWDHRLWFGALDVFLETSDFIKAKSVRHFLSILVSYIGNSESDRENAASRKALIQILGILMNRTSHDQVKAALQVLGGLFSKGLVSHDQIMMVCQELSIEKEPVDQNTIESDATATFVLSTLFFWIQFHNLAPTAGQTISSFFQYHQKYQESIQGPQEIQPHSPIWTEPLKTRLTETPETILAFRTHVFPFLFSLNVPEYYQFLLGLGLHDLLSRNPTEILDQVMEGYPASPTVLLAVLQVGKETGLIIDVDDPGLKTARLSGKSIEIRDTAFKSLVGNLSGDIRLAGLSFLVSSAATTRPFSQNVLSTLKSYLPHQFSETDPSIRGEMLTVFQKLVDRIRAITGPLHRTVDRGMIDPKSSTASISRMRTTLDRHEEFLAWFVRFVQFELRPDCGYQRHVFALKCIMIIAKSGVDMSVKEHLSKSATTDIKWSFSIELFTPWMIRALYDLVMNPFEDIRSLSASLLEMIRQDSDGAVLGPKNDTNILIRVLNRAQAKMLQTGRADHADGVSRISAILFRHCSIFQTSVSWWDTKLGVLEHTVASLENTITIAKSNLALAISNFKMHGTISSLRYILETPGIYDTVMSGDLNTQALWISLHHRICVALRDVWDCVRDVLCNDAPEGHIPEEMDDKQDLNTKDILSYSWRALKEASSLIRVLMLKATTKSNGDVPVLSPNDLKSLAFLCFTELAELRHRGAFSAVAQAFAACCVRTSHEGHSEELKNLYEKTLDCIKNNGSTTTRRSAGIPSLMTGILAADPAGDLFGQAMKDLQQQSLQKEKQQPQYGEPLPQVHALNSMKAIFTSTILGPISEPYIPQALNISGQCLISDVWAIRNCGLMLFRALIDRLLGSTESQNWSEAKAVRASRFSYKDYPNLLNIVMQLLEPPEHQLYSASGQIESVFPALKIIQRIPPPPQHRIAIRNSVFRLCGSSHWHVRDMAARTFSSLVGRNEFLSTIEGLLDSPGKTQNMIHGTLLCILYSAKTNTHGSNISSTNYAQKAIPVVLARSTSIYFENYCPFTQATFMDIVNYLMTVLVKHGLFNVDDVHSLESYSKKIGCIDMDTLNDWEIMQRAVALNQILFKVMDDKEPRHDSIELEQKSLDVGTRIKSLASLDPNACSWVLNQLSPLIQSLKTSSVTFLVNSLFDISCDATDNELATTAQSLLSEILEQNNVGIAQNQHLSFLPIKKSYFRTRAAEPSRVESTIRLWGLLLNHLYKRSTWSKSLAEEVHCILRALVPLRHETQIFPLRHMVILVLRGMSFLWQLSDTVVGFRNIVLDAYLLLFDCLNDDDDEIRHEASLVSSLAMAGGKSCANGKPTMPSISSGKLASVICRKFSQSRKLCVEAIRRTAGLSFGNEGLRSTAAERFQKVMEDNTALFVVEKQNLYINEVREAVVWSEVAKRLSPKAVSPKIGNDVSAWTLDAVELLSKRARAGIDGPLGWSSKPEVFTFGMQVLCLFDVLLTWSCMNVVGMELPREKMIKALLDLVGTARQSSLHEMWIAKAEQVLVNAVESRLLGASFTLQSICRKLA